MDRLVFDLQLFDTFYNSKSNASMIGTAGNDSIYNGGSYATINAGAGDDSIYNGGWNVTINAGAGDDTVYNSGNNVTVDAGAGDDSIRNGGDNVTINAGAGDDSIYNSSSNVTINAGTGNDTVVDTDSGESHNLIQTAGNLTVSIESYNDTIQTASALKNSVTSGNNMIFTTADNHTVKILNAVTKEVSVIDGKIFVDKARDTVTADSWYPNNEPNRVIVGSDGDDKIDNDSDRVTINAGAGDDSIGNWGSNVVITSGDGYDRIVICVYSKNVTITDLSEEDTLEWFGDGPGRFPRFATFNAATHVLNLGNIKINLPNVSKAADIRNVGVNHGKDYITLGELLDAPTPKWKISGTTATYVQGDKVLATITGLKSGLKVVNGEIAGIEVTACNEITLSKSVLGTGTVELSSLDDYRLALAADVTTATFVNDDPWEDYLVTGTWNLSGVSNKTATLQIKSTDAGYYTNGKKIGYIKQNTALDVATISGLASNVSLTEEGLIAGIDYYVEQWDGYLYGHSEIQDSSVFGSDNISVNSEFFGFAFPNEYYDDYGYWHINTDDYENKTITGGVGGDNIYFSKDSAVITTGKGGDIVWVAGKNNKILTGEGNDFVGISERYEWEDDVVVENTGNTVDTGVGDDLISGTAVTKAMITAGTGNDTVVMDTASYSTISTGDGDDFVAGTDVAVYDSWIDGSGTVITNSVINTGDGKDTIVVEGQPVYGYDEEMGAEYLDYNIPCENNTIDSGAGDDYIIARGGITKSVISTGEGNDSLMAASVDDNSSDTIVTGAGNDSIFARTLDNSSISSGANDDFINLGRNLDSSDDGIEINVIDSEGNVRKSSLDALMDSISYSSRNTINAGTGNDTIALGNRGGENVIQYTLGDGNDTVFGFKTTDTLQITSGSYSSVMSGDNLVVNVGGGSITLVDYGNKPLSVDHIYPDEPLVYNGHTYRIFTVATTWENAKAYCESLGGYLAVISDSDENKALYDYKVRQGYSTAYFGLSDAAKEGTWTWANGDTSTYRNWNSGEPNNGQGRFRENYAEIWLTPAWNDGAFLAHSPFICEWDSEAPSETGDLDHIVWTFSTVKGVYTATGKIGTKVVAKITNLKKGTTADSLSDNGKNIIKIASDALGTAKVTLTNTKGYSYKLAIDDEITSVTTPAGWSIEGTTASYKTLNRTEGYTVAANGLSISHNTAIAAKTLTTVSGLSESAKVSDFVLKKATVTVSANALGNDTVEISGGYDLALGSDVTKSTTGKASWKVTDTTAEYTSAKVTEGYVLAGDKKSIIYRPASGNEIVATLEGVKKNAPITAFSVNAKNVITIKKAALATDTDVTLSGDEIYTLALGSDVAKSKITAAKWSVSGTTAKYLTEAAGKGYAVYDEGKTISYIAEPEGGETVVTLKGLKKGATAKSLTFDDNNKVVIVAKAALTTTAVRIDSEGDEYNLALADDVNAAETTAADWSISGTTAKYLSAKTSEGYALSEDKQMISYNAASGGKTLVTVDGLKSGTTSDKLSLEGKTVKFAAEIFTNGANVGGKNYAFELTSAGKITNKGAAASLIGSNGNDILLGYTGADTLIGGAGKDSLNGGSGNDKLYGNGNDTLIGGKGNDILYSTEGNNTLTGGTGNDKFYFTAGNATITDYVAGIDKIYLDNNEITSWTVGTKDVTFTTSTGSITVKNGKGKKISVNDTAKKYTTSGSVSANIAELWFADEDNFATKDNISDITKSEVVGELENNSEERLSQENLITFAK